MPPVKRTPLRKCAGCGEQKPKVALVRVVRSPQGEFSLDTTGKAPGRGAYLCPNTACLAAARRAKRFEKAFACRLPDALYEELEEALRAHENG